MEILTPQAIKYIKRNNSLKSDIADILDLSVVTLGDLLRANEDDRLADPKVVQKIKDSLVKMQDMKIVEENNFEPTV